MKQIVWAGAAVVLLAVGVGSWWLLSAKRGEAPAVRVSEGGAEASAPSAASAKQAFVPDAKKAVSAASRKDGGDTASQQPEDEEPQTEEERLEAAAEAKVEAFDNLTDKWMDPAKAGVSMKDVDAFVAAFRQVPKDRQDECIHRALNLIPDDNVMLLAGVLMDKSADREVVETVFNDVLNRDEGVKKPILQQIFKDKTHPCWADTAWILDVTGELPGRDSQTREPSHAK